MDYEAVGFVGVVLAIAAGLVGISLVADLVAQWLTGNATVGAIAVCFALCCCGTAAALIARRYGKTDWR